MASPVSEQSWAALASQAGIGGIALAALVLLIWKVVGPMLGGKLDTMTKAITDGGSGMAVACERLAVATEKNTAAIAVLSERMARIEVRLDEERRVAAGSRDLPDVLGSRARRDG